MSQPVSTILPPALRDQIQAELTANILPFWLKHTVDRQNGGFYGAVTNDRQVLNAVPRSAVLCARILWTFASATRLLGDPAYREMADWAYAYLRKVFWDAEYGGLYWSVDAAGQPVFDRKHHYAQAFGIYGLSEYYRATGEPQALALAQTLFERLERHAFEPVYGGYLEGSRRDWGALADMRLSDKDLNCRKSMNTLLHILEAYTNLLRVWPDSRLQIQHRALIEVFLEQVIDPARGHFRLFFDDDWTSLQALDSYGHDIEGSWLLWEAAELQADPALSARVQAASLQLAAAVYRAGRDQDGSLFYEGGPQGLSDPDKSWWAQAEAMVGFYNAYQLSGEAHYAAAAVDLWRFIQEKHVDRVHGDWFKQLDRHGTPDLSHYKAGPWDCPYHHSRACFEMLARLD